MSRAGFGVPNDGHNINTKESNKMKETKQHITTEHKLVNRQKELEAAVILFACILGAGLIVLLALAMGN